MKILILIFLLIPGILFAECFEPSNNQMAIEWKGVNSSSTIEIENHWFYTASGTINQNFAFSSDENFFEIKVTHNRLLVPKYEKRPYGLKVYGPDWFGLETKMVRILCPGLASSVAVIDPWEGLGSCTHSFFGYEVQGSSTFLALKKGANPIKEIK